MKRILSSTFFIFILTLFFNNLTFAQEASISSGIPTQGKMTSSDTTDTYQFSTNEDGEVYITLDQTTTGFSMYLYDVNGNKLDGTYQYNGGDTIVINQKVQKGTYYIKILPYQWNGITSATYRLKATYASSIKWNNSNFEPNDTAETGKPIESGQIYKSNSESSLDQDAYKFTTKKDGEVYITLDQTTTGFSMYLYDVNGNKLDGTYQYNGGDTIVINQKVQKGTYYIKILPYQWNGITSATYRLKATYASSIKRNNSNFEPNDTIETSMKIISKKSYNSNSYSNVDRDVYQFTTNKDGNATISLDNTTTGFSMYLYDVNGNELDGTYQYNGGDAIVINQKVQKGTYYIKILPYQWNGITSATYRLKATYVDKIPSVNPVYNNSTVITGKAVSKTKVYAVVGSKKLGEATASNGKYSIKTSKQKAGTAISVYTVDSAGNRSANKTVKVLDKRKN